MFNIDINNALQSLETLAIQEQNLHMPTASEETRSTFANLHYVYQSDYSVIEESRTSCWQRQVTSLSLADYATEVAHLFLNKHFATYLELDSSDCLIHTRSNLENRHDDLNASRFCTENALNHIESLKNRIRREIIAIETANKAWGIFSFLRTFFTSSSIAALESAFEELNGARDAIRHYSSLTYIAMPSKPHKVEGLSQEGGIYDLTDSLFGKDKDLPSKSLTIKQQFIQFLETKVRSNSPLVIYNQKKVRSFQDVDTETEKVLNDIFAGINRVPSGSSIVKVRDRIKAEISIEIQNYHEAVVDFLKTAYGETKFAVIESEVTRRLQKIDTLGPLKAEELVDFCDTLAAIHVVTYKPAVGLLFLPQGRSVYFNALVASGLGTRLPKEETEKIADFLKRMTLPNGLIKFIGEEEEPFALVVNGDGSIPLPTLNRILSQYFSIPIQANSIQDLAHTFIERCVDTTPRDLDEDELYHLLENLGFKGVLNEDTLDELVDFLLDHPKFQLSHYASLEGKDLQDKRARVMRFNLSILDFLIDQAYPENKKALQSHFNNIFRHTDDSLAIHLYPCNAEEVKEMLAIARKKPENRGLFQWLIDDLFSDEEPTSPTLSISSGSVTPQALSDTED